MYEHVRLLPDGCPRIVLDGADPVPCGLLWQHDGPCVPFVPGDYLPPPIAHPLDMLRPRLFETPRCPMCRAAVLHVIAEYVTAFRGDEPNWDRASQEMQITVMPCGCVMRDLDD